MFEDQSVFHESYYEHSCLVVSEKDVLYTDIGGKFWGAAIERWWKNLFLLSYSDPRCRFYYASSQAMRLERSRQFRGHKGRIHPLSKFSNFWSCFISIVVLVNKLIFHYTTTIIFGRIPLAVYFVAVFLEFLVIIDIYINFKTGYIDKEARKIILDKGKVLLRYASTKLFIHCLCAIPLQTIMMFRYGMNVTCVLCKSNKFICTLKLLGVVGLFRLYDSSRHWIREGSSFKVSYFFRFLRIFFLGLITMLQMHSLANTINMLVMFHKHKIYDHSYFAMMIRIQYQSAEPPSNIQYLCMELSTLVKSLFLFGYGLKPKMFYLDMMAGLASFLIANIFFTWTLMECYAVVGRLAYSEDQNETHKERTINMMRCRQLSDKISTKVMDYYHFNTSRLVVIEKMNDLYQFLPSDIIKEIKLTSYTKHMKKIPYFEEWPADVIEDMVMLLKEDMYLANDIVADAWSKGEGLIIIDTGVLAVYTPDQKEAGHLIDGDYFGELSLVTDKEIRTSFVVATTRCKTLLLEKNEFRKYMRKYPNLFFDLRGQLRRKYRENRLSETSLVSAEPDK